MLFPLSISNALELWLNSGLFAESSYRDIGSVVEKQHKIFTTVSPEGCYIENGMKNLHFWPISHFISKTIQQYNYPRAPSLRVICYKPEPGFYVVQTRNPGLEKDLRVWNPYWQPNCPNFRLWEITLMLWPQLEWKTNRKWYVIY